MSGKVEISTWGVKKCIGGVAFSTERSDSPLSLWWLGILLAADTMAALELTALAAAAAAAATAFRPVGTKPAAAAAAATWDACDSRARSSDDEPPGPGLSKSMPCLEKHTRGKVTK